MIAAKDKKARNDKYKIDKLSKRGSFVINSSVLEERNKNIKKKRITDIKATK